MDLTKINLQIINKLVLPIVRRILPMTKGEIKDNIRKSKELREK